MLSVENIGVLQVRYLSVCSGIEAASVAWHPLGWEPVAFSEIEPFPCSVLEHRFPHVPNLGNMETFEEWDIEPGSVDVLVGGTPCQSFSIAGLRGGLKDGRGNLALTYCRIVQKLQPKWFVWENVPGVLSSNSGRDFGSIVGAMAELGYYLAYRVLDAQHFGVPQRRRRVFVVGCAGDWRRAAAVLFESGCVSGDTAKSKKQRQDITGTIASRTSAGGGLGTDFDLSGGLQVASTGDIAHCLNAGGMGRQDYETETMIVNTWGGERRPDRPEGGFYARVESTTKTLDASGGLNPACSNGGTIVMQRTLGVRRLTPRECERLQGFPDDWTLVPHRGKPAADGPRYKAIGNSMAVPVMRWIGSRISHVG